MQKLFLEPKNHLVYFNFLNKIKPNQFSCVKNPIVFQRRRQILVHKNIKCFLFTFYNVTDLFPVLSSYSRILFTYFRVAKSCIGEKLCEINYEISFQDIFVKKLNFLFKSA